MHQRSLPVTLAARVLPFLLPVHFAAGQVTIHERAVIDPGLRGPDHGPGTLLESVISPCHPPFDDPGPPVITRRSVFPGERLSLAALTCPGCPPHHMAGELTQGAGYVRLELTRPPGLGGEINGTSFHFREAWGYDVVAVFDQAVPADSALIKFTMTYVDFPPPNIEYIEVYFVPRQFRTVTRLEPAEVEQGGSSAISAWVQDQCEGGYPAAVTYTAAILSGGERGSLQNPLTLETGQELSGLPSPEGYMPTVVYLADGQDADSTTPVEIRITPSAPGVAPSRLVLPVKQGPTCPVVLLDPPDPAPGDTCRIRMMKKKFDGTITEYGPDQLFSIMLYPDEAGTLYSPHRTDTADYFNAVPQDNLMWLTAGEIAEESVSVYMWANEVVPGEKAEKRGVGGVTRGPDQEMCNAAFATLKQKPFKIMLGETKYYQAKYDPADSSKLVIQELGSPVLAGGIPEDVWGDHPVLRGEGQAFGVFWDKLQPVFLTDSTEPAMTALSPGLLRIVGRYWSASGSVSVVLAATHRGRRTEREVRVISPDLLGSRNNLISGPSAVGGVSQQWNIDSMIVSEAGKEGLQPQMIKAIMKKESGFFPTYRYEPFDDLRKIHNGKSGFDSSHRYWVQDQLDLGQPPPPIHENLRDGLGNLISYPGFQNLWAYYSSNARLYGKRIYASLQQKWNQLYQAARDSIRRSVNSDRRASDSAAVAAESSYVRWLKYELGDSGMIGLVAQTRIAASFGLMQLTYYGGVQSTRGYPGYNYPNDSEDYPPELLNRPDIGLKYGLLHFKKKIRDVLGNVPFGAESWSAGLEVIYWRALRGYNGSRRYPHPVFQFAAEYIPRRSAPAWSSK
jgi:hypothetical protein